MDMKKVDEIRTRLNNDSIIDFYDSTLQASMKKVMREGCEAIDYLKAGLDNQEKEIKAIYEENSKLQKRLKGAIRENAKLNGETAHLKRQIIDQQLKVTKYEVKIAYLKDNNENLFQKLNELRKEKEKKARLIWPGQIFTIDGVEYITDRIQFDNYGKEAVITCGRHEDWKRANICLFLSDSPYNIADLDDILRPQGYKIVPSEEDPFKKE